MARRNRMGHAAACVRSVMSPTIQTPGDWDMAHRIRICEVFRAVPSDRSPLQP
ncbi:hypothetical protein M404DRAFT_998201 [Pisolithus tinctorius Marx 270]|uniref:Uncharacterized protein n=1 Tax=Pisolithus tinctorius Marx 270 TaxID=870435 RepID=A0A0C3P369_PISTI|nr:hypothetical protein M404DRAFT_998201 [Pisolithus tinctorius Marx 270]